MIEKILKAFKKKDNLLAIPSLILVDIVLFHHMIPQIESTDLSKNNLATPERNIGTENSETVDANDWGSKFADKFTDGEVISDETSYKSKNINITITKKSENGVVYFIQDIYVRKIENLRTAFAQDKYGTGITDSVLDIAESNNAIAAINGDFYGVSSGVVIRNGYAYRGETTGDICVLYYNGEMKTFARNEFDYEREKIGAYQAWGFGPSLLADGKSKTVFDSTVNVENPRTVIGYYEPGHYCFIVVDGRQSGYSRGMTTAELSKLAEEIGCKEAYNLDGGRSSMMTFDGNLVNEPYGGGRSASDIILIREWEE